MILAIITLLILIALYCGVNWLFIFIMWASDRLMNEPEANQRAFQFGLIAVLAVGFAGLLLK